MHKKRKEKTSYSQPTTDKNELQSNHSLQSIHENAYGDYSPHNSYSSIIYSEPYAKANLLNNNPYKDQVFIQTLNPIIQPENVLEFSGISMNQAGNSMKRTIVELDEATDGVTEVMQSSDVVKDTSQHDDIVVVTPVDIISTRDKNKYKTLSNGLELNDIHEFTYNGLNLQQNIYKEIVDAI